MQFPLSVSQTSFIVTESAGIPKYFEMVIHSKCVLVVVQLVFALANCQMHQQHPNVGSELLPVYKQLLQLINQSMFYTLVSFQPTSTDFRSFAGNHGFVQVPAQRAPYLFQHSHLLHHGPWMDHHSQMGLPDGVYEHVRPSYFASSYSHDDDFSPYHHHHHHLHHRQHEPSSTQTRKEIPQGQFDGAPILRSRADAISPKMMSKAAEDQQNEIQDPSKEDAKIKKPTTAVKNEENKDAASKSEDKKVNKTTEQCQVASPQMENAWQEHPFEVAQFNEGLRSIPSEYPPAYFQWQQPIPQYLM